MLCVFPLCTSTGQVFLIQFKRERQRWYWLQIGISSVHKPLWKWHRLKVSGKIWKRMTQCKSRRLGRKSHTLLPPLMAWLKGWGLVTLKRYWTNSFLWMNDNCSFIHAERISESGLSPDWLFISLITQLSSLGWPASLFCQRLGFPLFWFGPHSFCSELQEVQWNGCLQWLSPKPKNNSGQPNLLSGTK